MAETMAETIAETMGGDRPYPDLRKKNQSLHPLVNRYFFSNPVDFARLPKSLHQKAIKRLSIMPSNRWCHQTAIHNLSTAWHVNKMSTQHDYIKCL